MELKLLKPIVFFDLETTGINIGTIELLRFLCLKSFLTEIKKAIHGW